MLSRWLRHEAILPSVRALIHIPTSSALPTDLTDPCTLNWKDCLPTPSSQTCPLSSFFPQTQQAAVPSLSGSRLGLGGQGRGTTAASSQLMSSQPSSPPGPSRPLFFSLCRSSIPSSAPAVLASTLSCVDVCVSQSSTLTLHQPMLQGWLEEHL